MNYVEPTTVLVDAGDWDWGVCYRRGEVSYWIRQGSWGDHGFISNRERRPEGDWVWGKYVGGRHTISAYAHLDVPPKWLRGRCDAWNFEVCVPEWMEAKIRLGLKEMGYGCDQNRQVVSPGTVGG